MSATNPNVEPSIASERWRRVARTGALLAIAATFITLGQHNLWGWWWELWDIACGLEREQLTDNELIPVLVFCIFSPSIYFSGIFNLFLFGPSIYEHRTRGYFHYALTLFLWFGTLAPAYIFTAIWMRRLWSSPWGGVLLAAMSLYLLAGLLCLLMSKHSPLTIKKMFWLEILPLFNAVVSYAGLFAYYILVSRLAGSYLLFCTLGLLGNLMMALGVRFWWRALAQQELQAAQSIATPSPPTKPQSKIRNRKCRLPP